MEIALGGNAALDADRCSVVRSRFLGMEAASLATAFDRQPLGFAHSLHELALFSDAALRDLTRRYDAHPRDFFVSAGARAAGSEFFKVPHGLCRPSEAMERLDKSSIRILLKRPEHHDHRFQKLLHELFQEVMALRGGLRGERLVRLESSVFITSAASTTPFHFDPEIAFFSQIEGDKIYHVYSPTALSEPELEKFYLQGQISIGHADLARCDPALEHVFQLKPGLGFHQPQNAPHWVETRASRSISYAFVFETDVSRARGQARAGNYYLRKFGLLPAPPGAAPAMDGIKAGAMRMLIPVRQRAAAGLRAVRGR